MNTAKKLNIAFFTIFGLASMLTMQNCSKVDFAEQPLVEPFQVEDLPDSQALVYGADAQDRKLLADKIKGYAAPSLAEIFNNWPRISGGALVKSASDIDLAKSPYPYCFTSLLPTGLWATVVPPGETKAISPSSDSKCASQAWFAALSWFYKDGRLHHATNSAHFNGFISKLKFDHYVNQAVLTSNSADDDEIGIVIAVVHNKEGIHTLSASRSQGGYTMANATGNQNWRIIYRRNNALVKAFGEQTVGTLHRNSGSPGGVSGDGKGWSGRTTLVRVARDGDTVEASTGDWGVKDAKAKDLSLLPASLIRLDLSDKSLGLEVFKGAQFIGYGIQSQPTSQFYDISFTALNDNQFVYDLEENKVYEQTVTGAYQLRGDLDAFHHLGFPRKVGNIETQKEFRLSDHRQYNLVN